MNDFTFKTDVKYETREEKPEYVWSKYHEILEGKILDVGGDKCGLRNLISPASSYIGIGLGGTVDIEINFEKEAIPFEDNSFDCVLCLDVLEHLDNIHDIFDKLCQLTKSYVIIALPNPHKSFLAYLFRGNYDKDHSLKYYHLPVNKPEDRHKWFYNIREAERFVTERAKLNNMEIVDIDKEKNINLRNKVLFLFLRILFHKKVNVHDLVFTNRSWIVLKKN